MKKFFKYAWRTLSTIVVIIVAVHVVSALTLDRTLHYTEISFTSPKIDPELDGYVIAFVTDTHDIAPEKLERMTERINARNVDLLLLGGDYVWHDSDGTMRIFSKIETKDGVYGVDGNHDSLRDLMKIMPKYGFTLLPDTGRAIRPGFYLGGVTFFGGDKHIPSIKDALANANPDDFVLLLAHNPDIAEMQDSSGADLVLAGHTHGGQITFLGLWAPALKMVTVYGNKFKAGWADTSHGSKVYVSRGVGTSGSSTRIFAWPQVVFVTLHATPE